MNEFNLESAQAGAPIQYMANKTVSPYQLKKWPELYEGDWVDCKFNNGRQYVNLMITATINNKTIYASSGKFRLK